MILGRLSSCKGPFYFEEPLWLFFPIFACQTKLWSFCLQLLWCGGKEKFSLESLLNFLSIQMLLLQVLKNKLVVDLQIQIILRTTKAIALWSTTLIRWILKWTSTAFFHQQRTQEEDTDLAAEPPKSKTLTNAPGVCLPVFRRVFVGHSVSIRWLVSRSGAATETTCMEVRTV